MLDDRLFAALLLLLRGGGGVRCGVLFGGCVDGATVTLFGIAIALANHTLASLLVTRYHLQFKLAKPELSTPAHATHAQNLCTTPTKRIRSFIGGHVCICVIVCMRRPQGCCCGCTRYDCMQDLSIQASASLCLLLVAMLPHKRGAIAKQQRHITHRQHHQPHTTLLISAVHTHAHTIAITTLKLTSAVVTAEGCCCTLTHS